jgi:ATP synthase protein I
MNSKKQQKEIKKFDTFIRYSTMGFQMAVIIGVGVFGGIESDAWLKLRFPLFTVLLSIASVGIAMYIFIKDVTNPKQ